MPNESARNRDGQTGGSSARTRKPSNRQRIAVSARFEDLGRIGEYDFFGGFLSLATAQTLNSVTDIVVSTGVGRLVLGFNAGTDVDGTVTLTGTTVSPITGDETPADTEVITVTKLSVNSSDTDANGNTRLDFDDLHITVKSFKNTVTISTTNTDFTDVNVSWISAETLAATPEFIIDSFDLGFLTRSVSAEIDAYLYALQRVGTLTSIKRISSINETSVVNNRFYARSEFGIGETINGRTSGFFVQMFSAANNSIEDFEINVWMDIVAEGTSLLTIKAKDSVVGPSSAVDGNIAVFDGITGTLIKDGLVAPGAFYRVDGSNPLSAGFAMGSISRQFLNTTGDVVFVVSGSGSNRNYVVVTAQGTGQAAQIKTLGVDVDVDLEFAPKGGGILKGSGKRFVNVVTQDTRIFRMDTPTASEDAQMLYFGDIADIEEIFGVTEGASTDLTLNLVSRARTAPFSGGTALYTAGTFVPDDSGVSKTTGFTQIDGTTTPQVVCLVTTGKTGSPTKLFLAITFRAKRT